MGKASLGLGLKSPCKIISFIFFWGGGGGGRLGRASPLSPLERERERERERDAFKSPSLVLTEKKEGDFTLFELQKEKAFF
jgi:hypothetical protein